MQRIIHKAFVKPTSRLQIQYGIPFENDLPAIGAVGKPQSGQLIGMD